MDPKEDVFDNHVLDSNSFPRASETESIAIDEMYRIMQEIKTDSETEDMRTEVPLERAWEQINVSKRMLHRDLQMVLQKESWD